MAEPDFTALLAGLLRKGRPFDEALQVIRSQGASPVGTIKAIRTVKNVTLSEAKEAFIHCSTWADIRESHKQFIGDLIETLNRNEREGGGRK